MTQSVAEHGNRATLAVYLTCERIGGVPVPCNIAIVVFPEVEELDFVGPWEVFSSLRSFAPETCNPFIVSEHGGEVRCAKGLRVLADYSFENAPRADIVLVPGGMGTRTEVDNPRLIDYVQRASRDAELTTSVCTGAFILERAGLLAGKRATTHWRSLDRLRALGTVEVVEERWVDEGAVVTSSGVSAGIDMALYLVGRLWGPEMARKVQKGIEYFPAPPYADIASPTGNQTYSHELPASILRVQAIKVQPNALPLLASRLRGLAGGVRCLPLLDRHVGWGGRRLRFEEPAKADNTHVHFTLR